MKNRSLSGKVVPAMDSDTINGLNEDDLHTALSVLAGSPE